MPNVYEVESCARERQCPAESLRRTIGNSERERAGPV